MDILVLILPIAIGILLIYLLANFKNVVIYEYQRGLLFKQGQFVKVLGPGLHRIFGPRQKVQKIDIRTHSITIPGQEILSSDNISIKVSLAASFKVEDPYLAIVEVIDYVQALYLELQVILRDILGGISIDDFLTKRQEISEILMERSKQKASRIGLTIETVAIKDIMFPGDLKNIFAQVVKARKEGLASLERARGESAALRNLANSAKLIEKNPGLLQLRLLQAIENNPDSTIILGDLSESTLKPTLLPSQKTDKH